MNYKGTTKQNPKISPGRFNYGLFATWDIAEESYPGCSIYWDRDLGSVIQRDMTLRPDGQGLLTAYLEGGGWYEYRCDPVPHWVSMDDARIFNANYGEGMRFHSAAPRRKTKKSES